jgi:N-methylhydantoinase A
LESCGLDPRDFVLYSYGGAGPVHAFGYAAEIGVREVLIPLGNGASTLSAYGIAAGDVARFVELEIALRAPFDDAALSKAVADAVRRARQSMVDAGVAEEPRIDVWALMRYQEQLMHALEVPVDQGGSAAQLVERFVHEYAQRYGASAASAFQAAEVFALRVRARVPGSAPDATPGAGVATSGAVGRVVPVFWPDAGERMDTTLYDGARFTDGDAISGPALVELPHTTVAVPRGATLTADRGHFRLLLPTEVGR